MISQRVTVPWGLFPIKFHRCSGGEERIRNPRHVTSIAGHPVIRYEIITYLLIALSLRAKLTIRIYRELGECLRSLVTEHPNWLLGNWLVIGTQNIRPSL